MIVAIIKVSTISSNLFLGIINPPSDNHICVVRYHPGGLCVSNFYQYSSYWGIISHFIRKCNTQNYFFHSLFSQNYSSHAPFAKPRFQRFPLPGLRHLLNLKLPTNRRNAVFFFQQPPFLWKNNSQRCLKEKKSFTVRMQDSVH